MFRIRFCGTSDRILFGCIQTGVLGYKRNVTVNTVRDCAVFCFTPGATDAGVFFSAWSFLDFHHGVEAPSPDRVCYVELQQNEYVAS